jgi:AraC family transcriptional activator of pyochelin receptor
MMKYIEIQPFSPRKGGFFSEVDCAVETFSGKPGSKRESLTLIISLEGRLRGQCRACGHSFELSAGQALLFSAPEGSLRLEKDGAGHVKSVLMHVDPALFGRRSVPEPTMPELLPDRTQKAVDFRHLRPVALSPLMSVIGRQILDCSLDQPVRDIYLNGKALEMLACCLTALEKDPRSGHDCPCRLREGEKEKIRLARDILVSDLENPPSLEQLAARTGLNATKLKRGFRQLYGTSVFDYFRNYRLETARRILEKDQVSVTEAAMTVGYSNIGHFCAAFKKQYGASPGHWLRRPSAAVSSVIPGC